MADLSADADRGQLVLVTGLAIATALLVLVLLLNTAIYTQNLATRDAEIGEGDALEYRNAVVDGTGDIVDAENDAEYDSFDAVRTNVSDGVAEVDLLLSRRHAEHGTLSDVGNDSATYHEGRLVRQTDDGRNFTDATGLVDDWTVALGVNDTRRYAITVDDSSLASTDAENATVDGFHVRITANGSTTEWSAAIYTNATTGDIAVAVDPPDASEPSQVCSVDRSEATVDLTAGTLAGEPCPGLNWREGVGAPYDVTYRNGGSAAGTYNLTVNVSGLATVTTPLEVNDDPADGSPYAVPAVYSATFTLSYETADVRYVDQVRIAPGESDA